MSQLQQVPMIDVRDTEGGQVEPGSLVYHVDDIKSMGMVVSQKHQDLMVLWSKQPQTIQVQTVPVTSKVRKFKTTWTTEIADDLRAYYGMSPVDVTTEIEEYRIHASQVSPEEMEELSTAVAKLTLHDDGMIEVERETRVAPEVHTWR